MSEDRLCPSARCEPGAVLLGIVGSSGVVGYVSPKTTVDEAFVEKARQGRTPEKRFRFAGACIEAGCGHWTGERCGVIDQMLGFQSEGRLPVQQALPACTIRPSCRWFAQSGPSACRVCPFVVTDLREEAASTRT